MKNFNIPKLKKNGFLEIIVMLFQSFSKISKKTFSIKGSPFIFWLLLLPYNNKMYSTELKKLSLGNFIQPFTIYISETF